MAILLDQDLANFFYKRPDYKYIRLYGSFCLCLNYLTLPLLGRNNHREDINEWVWLCSNKVLFLFIKTRAAVLDDIPKLTQNATVLLN